MISGRSIRKAAHLLSDPVELTKVLNEARAKANKAKKALWKVWEDFLTLFRFCKSWVVGEYRGASTASLLWAIAAIVYFLNPFDVIPDLLPGGYIDDVAIIGWVLRKIQVDIEKFRLWEATKSGGGGALPPADGSPPPTNETP